MSTGTVRDWHQPRNVACPHNSDPRFDCACKRMVNRKPYRVFRVNDRTVGHRTNPKLIAEIWPDGRVVLHESKRRRRYETTLGKIYEGLVWREAMLAAQAKKKARKTRGRK